ncbi:MAG: hypothetical protein IJ187_08625 [Neisseriaceae bacterium]|nr:hypothetical protein [Neisseriaceae bacterium]
MKNIFQIIILSLTASLFLTACSQEQRQEIRQKIQEKQMENAIKKLPTHNEPMPEYPQIKPPSELSNEEIDKNVQYVTTQVVEKSNKIIFFAKEEQQDGERNLVENKENSEYYRSILGYTADGNCAIQDFYSENDKKQIEPMIVKKDECESWKAQPFDGMAVWYDKDGKISGTPNVSDRSVLWFKQGKLERILLEKKDGDFTVLIQGEENIRPNIDKTIWTATKKEPDTKRSPVFECEYNNKENKIEQLIIFFGDNYVGKFYFNNNKIDTSKSTRWREDGYGYIDSVTPQKAEDIQKHAISICGVEEQSDEKAKTE